MKHTKQDPRPRGHTTVSTPRPSPDNRESMKRETLGEEQLVDQDERDDAQLTALVRERLANPEPTIRVTLDDL